VHDAILIEAPVEELPEAIARTQEYMAEASDIVLDGFRLRTEAKVVLYPDRYSDEKGAAMWELVWRVVEKLRRPMVEAKA